VLALCWKQIERGRIPRDESIVVGITGNGYKATGSIEPLLNGQDLNTPVKDSDTLSIILAIAGG
jgi:threonine synthase